MTGIAKSYREGERERVVFRDASLTVGQGEWLFLLGRSGSGKSTLLNLISGIDLPDAGEVVVDGTTLNRLSERDRTLFRRDSIGFVFQFYNLIPTLTVMENLLLPLELAGDSPRGARARRPVISWSRSVWPTAADSYPDRLSGGEQQRVAVARALVHDPSLLLADEPTGNLDAETGARCSTCSIAWSARPARPWCIVTHSAEVARLADRVMTIRDGRLVRDRSRRSSAMILWRAGFRHLLRHPWQTVLAVVGVALGVAVVTAVDLANESAQPRLPDLPRETVAGKATHQVVGGPAGLAEELYATLRVAMRSAADARRSSRGTCGLPAAPGRPSGCIGVDPFAETALPAFSSRFSSGRVLERLLAVPDTVPAAAARPPHGSGSRRARRLPSRPTAANASRYAGRILAAGDEAEPPGAGNGRRRRHRHRPGAPRHGRAPVPHRPRSFPRESAGKSCSPGSAAMLPPGATVVAGRRPGRRARPDDPGLPPQSDGAQPPGARGRHVPHLQHHDLFGHPAPPAHRHCCAPSASPGGRSSRWSSAEALLIGAGRHGGRAALRASSRRGTDPAGHPDHQRPLLRHGGARASRFCPDACSRGRCSASAATVAAALPPALEATAAPPRAVLSRSDHRGAPPQDPCRWRHWPGS